jgi:hypothetical protein
VLAALGGLLGAACGSADTVVLVGVQGMTPRPIRQLQVSATVGPQSRALRVPEQPGDPIFLPTNFSLQIPRALRGSLKVAVTAIDETGQPMASGEGVLAALVAGTRNDVTVVLGGTADGGAPDAAPDAGVDAEVPDAPAADAGVDAAPDAENDAAPPDVEPDEGPPIEPVVGGVDAGQVDDGG